MEKNKMVDKKQQQEQDSNDVEIILEKSVEKKPVEKKPVEKKPVDKPGATTPRPPVAPFNDIPRIFCANKEVAKKLFGDFLVVVGALKAIETGELQPGDTM